MPPPAGSKRKRGDRTYSDDQQYSRPSPHRPGSLNLAHQASFQGSGNDRDYNQSRGRGGRRYSRGGRGGGFSSSPVTNPSEAAAPTLKTPPADPEPSNTNGTMAVDMEFDSPPVELSSPPPETQPYNYTYFTKEVCSSWETGGRADVLRQSLEALQDESTATLDAIMQELVQSVVFSRVQPSDAGDLIKEVLQNEDTSGEGLPSPPSATPAQAALLDSLCVFFEGNTTIPVDRLSVFLATTGISPDLLRLELDAPLLEKLDLIRNTFNRMGIRKQTNLLYRQANFNLMREESEGFAKLMTELFTTSGNEPPTAEVVEDTVEKVKAMIGAFDLDVGRSLDVVLDVFGAVLVKQFRFFVKFLRASPWWPRSPGLDKPGATGWGLPLWALPGSSEWHLTEEQKLLVERETEARDSGFWPRAREQGLQAFYLLGRTQAPQDQLDRACSAGDETTTQWIKETGTLPASGNRDAAQLLGFKLRFYSSSPARDETDVLPDHLIYLAALLIKIGFISLKDLYAHIWRTDEEMEELKQQKIKEKAERERAARPGAGAKNALLMAGALADDTLPVPSRLKESTTRASTPSKEVEAQKPAIKDTAEPADQKVLLLKSLLAIGALPEALFILGKFPWLIDLFPELPEYIHRILHHCLSKVYSDVRPLQDRPSLREQKPAYETDLPGLQKGQVKIVATPERKVLRWALLDRNDSTDGTDYRFYWDEWNDNIPVCQTVDDVFTLCETLLPLVGVKIGQDPGLLLKIARIGKHSLQTDKTESNRSRWLDLSKRVLLPALSLTKSNAGVVNEVFEMISHFSVHVRYLMYLEWLSGKTSRNPDVKAAFDQAKAETKDILKRISNTNVRLMARALAKVAFANPHVVITTALTQIEVYDSIAEVFVEGARYFTDLGYDVLTWAIVSSMAKAGRSRTQEGGIFTSRWLSALAHFAGKIYKRYGMMRPGPILQYVFQQLEQGNTTDLKMLEQIVVSMAGIATDTSYNDTQLQAMGGGPLLQSQTILQLLDRRHDSRKTSERLMRSLQETGLAAKFLISMAQQRQACVFEAGDVPLKAVANTYDEIHRVMVQYVELLRSNLTAEDFRATVPDVASLLIDYEITPEVAFWVNRPLISKQMAEYDKDHAKDLRADELAVSKEVHGDVEMSDQINGGAEEDGEAVETENVAADTPASDTMNSAIDLDSASRTPAHADVSSEDCWHPVMKDVMTAIQPVLPGDVVETIGTGFYATFWQLSLYDITIPGKPYEDELSRQHKKIAAISADRSDVSVSGTKKKEAAKKEITDLIDKLLVENKQHLKAFAESKARLQREKNQWFDGKARMDKQLNTALMEHCFLPRILFSPLDAYFCFKFVKFLHGAGTPHFRTLGFYDLLFRPARLQSLIFLCTSKEADNLGRFLNEVLKDLSRWHGSKATYEREAWGSKKNLPGFAMKVENGKVVSLLDFESFRRVLYKWHGNMFAALQKCLTSPEYMHARNAISVMRAVSAVYPVVNWHGTGLQKAVDKLRESDKEDLKVSSAALLGALHRREKSWVIPQAFRQGQDKNGEHDQGASQAKSETTKDKASAEAPSAKLDEAKESKDVVMTDEPAKPEIKEDVKKTEPSAPAKSDQARPSAEPSRPIHRTSSAQASRPPANGASMPSQQEETSTLPRRESRPSRPDSTRPHGHSRRQSPAPLPRPLPPSLPSRPEPPETRNGPRDSPRLSSRGPSEAGAPIPDARSSRDVRSGYRGHEGPLEDYERPPRRYEQRSLHPGREERVHGREHERPAPYGGRSLLSERERPSVRPPPTDRERDNRDVGPGSRGPPAGESTPHDASVSQKDSSVPPSQVAINPARAALIEGGAEPRHPSPMRSSTQDRPTRSSRPTSPRREDDRRPYPRRDPDERSYASPRTDPSATRQAYTSSATEPPSGGRSTGAGGYSRDSRQAPPIDMQHGRLEQETSQRALSSTNADRSSEVDVPSGPRNRPASGPGPRLRGPPLNTQASPSDRPTPTGPSRRHGRTSSYNDGPSTPGAPADAVGVHPSRLNRIDPAGGDASRPTEGPHQNHPSGAPAGPRGNAPPGAPSGPSPTTRGPPSGPHGGDMGGQGGRNNRHPLTAVNNTLAQAGTSIRGRGGMRSAPSGGYGPHMAPPPPPPPPGGPSSHGSNSNGYPPQQDLFASGNPNDVPIATRPPSTRHDSARGPRSELIDDRGSDRRSSRHSSRHDDARGSDRGYRGERDGREPKDSNSRHGGGGGGGPDSSSKRDDRSSSRRENYNSQQEGDERERVGGGGYSSSRSGPPRGDDQSQSSSRKHGRGDEGPPYSGGSGGGSGSMGHGGNSNMGGRGGSRIASESKRARRGP
ncbi:THO complex subunit 2 [Exophiala dermatitidis]